MYDRIVGPHLRVLFTAILLPYTLKKSQKVMAVVIANAQKEFSELEQLLPESELPENNNEKDGTMK